jgi:hypothetical protein
MSAVTIYGVCAVSFMMVMYALEPRGRGFVLAFAAGCLLSSAYGFLSGAWPFGVIQPFRVRVARPRGDRRCGSGLRRAGLRPRAAFWAAREQGEEDEGERAAGGDYEDRDRACRGE